MPPELHQKLQANELALARWSQHAPEPQLEHKRISLIVCIGGACLHIHEKASVVPDALLQQVTRVIEQGFSQFVDMCNWMLGAAAPQVQHTSRVLWDLISQLHTRAQCAAEETKSKTLEALAEDRQALELLVNDLAGMTKEQSAKLDATKVTQRLNKMKASSTSAAAELTKVGILIVECTDIKKSDEVAVMAKAALTQIGMATTLAAPTLRVTKQGELLRGKLNQLADIANNNDRELYKLMAEWVEPAVNKARMSTLASPL